MPINKGYLNSGRTKESDECLTPRYVINPILKYLKQKNFKNVWCPFDLDHSLYVRILKQNGYNVTNTHILGGGNFLDINPDTIDFDVIVSNPPFTLKDEVLERLYEINKPFAILLPIQSLQSAKRTPLFIKNGLQLLCFDKRACFYTNNEMEYIKFGNHFASAYFCKDFLPKDLIFEILEPKQEPYYERG